MEKMKKKCSDEASEKKFKIRPIKQEKQCVKHNETLRTRLPRI